MVIGCNYPVRAYRCADGSVVFDERKGDVVSLLHFGCGRCYGCLMDRARGWATRCVHEAKMHRMNSFVTLTYNDDRLPPNGELLHRHFQLFMKRLRRRFPCQKIKFYMCGEYGDLKDRPHFHAILFGIDFLDKKLFKVTSGGQSLYTSAICAGLWTDSLGRSRGFHTIGNVDFESCAYVARYVMKKVNGRDHLGKYDVVDHETGVVYSKQREYTKMSLKGGIGKSFLVKYTDDIFNADVCVVNGKFVKPPRYYVDKLKELDYDWYQNVRSEREAKGSDRNKKTSPEFLRAREKDLVARVKQYHRELHERG